MKRHYSIYYPQNVCKAVHKPLHVLIFKELSSLIVDISNLSTISSSEYYAAIYNISRCSAVLSTNPLCL